MPRSKPNTAELQRIYQEGQTRMPRHLSQHMSTSSEPAKTKQQARTRPDCMQLPTDPTSVDALAQSMRAVAEAIARTQAQRQRSEPRMTARPAPKASPDPTASTWAKLRRGAPAPTRDDSNTVVRY